MNQADLKVSPSGLVDLTGAAAYLGCGLSAVRYLRRTKQLRCLTLGGRLRFKISDLDAYVERNLAAEGVEV